MAEQSIVDMINDYMGRGTAGAQPAPSPDVDAQLREAVQASPLYQSLDAARADAVDRLLNSGVARYLMQTPVLDAAVTAAKEDPATASALPKGSGPLQAVGWLLQNVKRMPSNAVAQVGDMVNYLAQNLPSYGNPRAQHPAPQSFSQMPGVSPAAGALADIGVTGAAVGGMPEITGAPGIALGVAKRLPGAVERGAETMKAYDAVKRAQNFASELSRELGSLDGLSHLSEQEFTHATKMVTRMAGRPSSVSFFLERLGVPAEEAQKAAQKVAKITPRGIGNGTLADALDVYDRNQPWNPQYDLGAVNRLFEGMTDEEAQRVFEQIANEGGQVAQAQAYREVPGLGTEITGQGARDFHKLINDISSKGMSDNDAIALDAAYNTLSRLGTFTTGEWAREATDLGASAEAIDRILSAHRGEPVFGAADAMKDIVMPQRLASGEKLIQQALPADRFQPSHPEGAGRWARLGPVAREGAISPSDLMNLQVDLLNALPASSKDRRVLEDALLQAANAWNQEGVPMAMSDFHDILMSQNVSPEVLSDVERILRKTRGGGPIFAESFKPGHIADLDSLIGSDKLSQSDSEILQRMLGPIKHADDSGYVGTVPAEWFADLQDMGMSSEGQKAVSDILQSGTPRGYVGTAGPKQAAPPGPGMLPLPPGTSWPTKAPAGLGSNPTEAYKAFLQLPFAGRNSEYLKDITKSLSRTDPQILQRWNGFLDRIKPSDSMTVFDVLRFLEQNNALGKQGTEDFFNAMTHSFHTGYSGKEPSVGGDMMDKLRAMPESNGPKQAPPGKPKRADFSTGPSAESMRDAARDAISDSPGIAGQALINSLRRAGEGVVRNVYLQQGGTLWSLTRDEKVRLLHIAFPDSPPYGGR